MTQPTQVHLPVTESEAGALRYLVCNAMEGLTGDAEYAELARLRRKIDALDFTSPPESDKEALIRERFNETSPQDEVDGDTYFSVLDSSPVGEALVQQPILFARLAAVFQNGEDIIRWMSSPLTELKGRAPIELLPEEASQLTALLNSAPQAAISNLDAE